MECQKGLLIAMADRIDTALHCRRCCPNVETARVLHLSGTIGDRHRYRLRNLHEARFPRYPFLSYSSSLGGGKTRYPKQR
jgi:hypothetical protein